MALRQEPDKTNELKLLAFDYERELAGGNYLIINHSDKAISGTVGTRSFNFETGDFGILDPIANEIDNAKQRSYIDVAFFFEKEKQLFMASRWRFSEKARTILFFYNDPITGKVRTHTIRDFL